MCEREISSFISWAHDLRTNSIMHCIELFQRGIITDIKAFDESGRIRE